MRAAQLHLFSPRVFVPGFFSQFGGSVGAAGLFRSLYRTYFGVRIFRSLFLLVMEHNDNYDAQKVDVQHAAASLATAVTGDHAGPSNGPSVSVDGNQKSGDHNPGVHAPALGISLKRHLVEISIKKYGFWWGDDSCFSNSKNLRPPFDQAQ